MTVASVHTCQAHCLYFSFFYKCTTDLDQARAPVTISWAQAPYPGAPCTLTTFNGTVHASIYNAPLAMHFLSDIRPEPARGLISFWYQTWGLISFWYQTWGLISFWYQTWGLISFWYQTCDGSGFEFVRTNYVQVTTTCQTALQLFSTMGEASHLCRFTLVVDRFD